MATQLFFPSPVVIATNRSFKAIERPKCGSIISLPSTWAKPHVPAFARKIATTLFFEFGIVPVTATTSLLAANASPTAFVHVLFSEHNGVVMFSQFSISMIFLNPLSPLACSYNWTLPFSRKISLFPLEAICTLALGSDPLSSGIE